MTAGGNINTVLTLDASKFSAALDKATSDLTKFDKNLEAAAKIAADFDKNVKGLNSGINTVSDRFKLLDHTISSFVAKLAQSAEGMSNVGRATAGTKKAVDGLNDSLNPTSKSFSQLSKAQSDFRASIDALGPAIQRAAKSYLDLDDAVKASNRSAKETATGTVEARLQALKNEKAINDKLIAERKHTIEELEKIERNAGSMGALTRGEMSKYKGNARNSQNFQNLKSEAESYENDAKLVRQQIDDIRAIVRELTAKNQEVVKSLDLTEKENVELQKTLQLKEALKDAEKRGAEHRRQVTQEQNRLDKEAALEQKRLDKEAAEEKKRQDKEATAEKKRQDKEAAAEKKRLDKEAADEQKRLDREAAAEKKRQDKEATAEKKRQDKEAAEEKKRLDKQAADEAKAAALQLRTISDASARASSNAILEQIKLNRQLAEEQKRQAQQAVEMWKGIGQMWAASKIERGIGASVSSAGEMERAQLYGQGLNLSQKEQDYITKKSWDDSKALKFVSVLDMVKARYAAIGGLGENNVKVIDSLLGSASKVAFNIQALTGDHSKGGFENMIRNLFGAIEMRQQTNDPEGAKRTFDLVQKMYLASGGKIDISDIETVFRRQGSNTANNDDIGIAQMLSIIDQAKVSGGHGGGGAAGVSTVGTMLRMFEKLATGGLKTVRGTKQLAESGLIDFSAAEGLEGKQAIQALRESPLKNAKLATERPIEAMKQIADAALAYMTRPENLKKFFPDGDTNDPKAKRAAIQTYMTGLGLNSSASSIMSMFGDERAVERMRAQTTTTLNSKGGEQFNADVMKTYESNIAKFNASLENLKISLGTSVLPIMTGFFDIVSKITTAFGNFTKENPLTTEITLIGSAVSATVLGLKGMLSLMGIPGKLVSALALIGPSITQAGAATTMAGKAVEASNKSWLSMSGNLNAIRGHWETFAASTKTNTQAAVLASGIGSSKIGSSLRLLGSTVAGTATLIGKSFLRMIPLVGQLLLAWDFANVISELEVGGNKVKDWLAGLMDWLITKASNGWERIKDAFTLGKNSAEHEAQIKANNADFDYRWNVNLGDKKTVDLNAIASENKSGPSVGPTKEAAEKGKSITTDTPMPKNVSDAFNSQGKEKPQRDFENMFLKSLASVESKAEIGKLKIQSQLTGNPSYKEQAMAEFKSHWLGGDFDEGHDPKKRLFLKSGAKLGPGGFGLDDMDLNSNRKVKIGEETKSVKEWVEAWTNASAAQREATDQVKSNTFAMERSASAAEEADMASTRLAEGGLPKQTDAMKALFREFTREEQRSVSARNDAKDPESKYSLAKNAAILNRARADLDNFSADMISKAKEINSKLTQDAEGRYLSDTERLRNEFDAVTKVEEDKFNVVKNALDERLKLEAEGSEAYIKIKKDEALAVKAFQDYMEARAKEKAQIKSPLQQLAGEWANTANQLEKAQASWAQKMMDGLINISQNGIKSFKDLKLGVKDIFSSITNDVGSMLIKKTFGGVVEKMAGGIGSMVGNIFGLDTKGMGAAPDGSEGSPFYTISKTLGLADEITGGKGADGEKSFFTRIKEGFGTVWTRMQEGFGGIWGSVKGLFGNFGDMFKNILNGFDGDFSKLLSDMGGNLKGIFSSIIGMFTGGSGGGSEVGGILGFLGTAASAFSGFASGGATVAAEAGMAGSMGAMSNAITPQFASMAFANGGIMTNMGAIPLAKYANGGIANSPQLALFGEGSMNEAYVPLPDGRSIPVNMRGQNKTEHAGDQVINISIVVNQDSNGSGDESKAAAGTNSNQWEQMANRIKSVVRQELVGQQRPGGLLYK